MSVYMDYSKANEWILGEKQFDSRYLGKCEAIMSLGNGYMGIRSATEERYLNEKRDTFVAGTFNKFDENEVTELPNVADVIGMDFEFNGETFSLEQGIIEQYNRELNLKTGELVRTVIWTGKNGVKLELIFKRIVSMCDLHVIAQKIVVKPLNQPITFKMRTGIDGSVTNSGVQHFSEGAKRFYENQYMQLCQETTETKIQFVLSTVPKFFLDGNEMEVKSHIAMDRRKIYCEYVGQVETNSTFCIEKISNIYTSRDKEYENYSLEQLQQLSLEQLKKSVSKGYDLLAQESKNSWYEKVWSGNEIEIESDNPMDQLAIRFAQYHLHIMTPAHDNRMNIGAKGLSGEGYKGHTFWDTDIFALPYFTFTNPQIARSLEEYRYLSLGGAHKKAKDNQYEGAQFPWESAWLEDGEVTPVWGAADIITGLPTKIWSGFIEQHITADVAYGVWQYYMVTKDQDFMDRYGYELLMDTAKFWASRLEWSEDDKRYHINNVIGPDEYKEHVNDNAFTNYMAYWNIKIAIEYYEQLKRENPTKWQELNKKMELERVYSIWQERVSNIYLPQPREDGVIPQDATYLTLPIIDVTKYKNREEVGTLFKDYNLEQVNKMQVSKQADIMILFFLMEDLFSQEIKRANWNYYEPKTLHDSSLSLSTHVILANDMKDLDLAYQLFQKAIRIDMGENMKSSDHGIHAASIAGIWQGIVFGFGGVRMLNGKLRINPNLPSAWKKLKFSIMWHGQKLQIFIDENEIIIENKTQTEEVELDILGEKYQCETALHVKYKK